MQDRPGRVVDLAHAIRAVRIAQSEQNDVVADLKEAEQARLELLSEALERVYKDLPPGHEQLLLGLLPGRPPRFWVDATSFVMMGRDKRQYRFVKDTRLGRTVLRESASLEVMVDAITRYVAERIVEREQAIEADWLTAAVRARDGASPTAGEGKGRGPGKGLTWGIAGFGLGVIAGMALLLAYAWLTAG
jgi:hypothetical protein